MCICATTRTARIWARVGDGEFDNLGQIRAMLKDGYRHLHAGNAPANWRM
jgi:hypothetical protein